MAPLFPELKCRAHERGEDRVRLVWLALVLGVELAAEEPGVILQLHDFAEQAVWAGTRGLEASSGELVAVVVVDLVAVTMPLLDLRCPVDGVGEGALLDAAGVAAQAHRAALHRDLLLLFHQVDHGVGGALVELAAVGAIEAEHVAGELHDGHLHTKADSEVRDPVLPGVADGGDLSLAAAFAEPAGDEDSVDLGDGRQVALLKLVRADEFQLYARLVWQPTVSQGLVEALVGLHQVNVLAHDPDAAIWHELHGDVPQLGPTTEVDGKGGRHKRGRRQLRGAGTEARRGRMGVRYSRYG